MGHQPARTPCFDLFDIPGAKFEPTGDLTRGTIIIPLPGEPTLGHLVCRLGQRVVAGDFIIRDVNGDYYLAAKDDDFLATYDPVDVADVPHSSGSVSTWTVHAMRREYDKACSMRRALEQDRDEALRIGNELSLETQTLGELVADLVRQVREARQQRDDAHAALRMRDTCWHCYVSLAPPSDRPRCTDCPAECDIEGCSEQGCETESEA